jgi:hypothetical protein
MNILNLLYKTGGAIVRYFYNSALLQGYNNTLP